MLLLTCPTNLYLIYRLVYHMLSTTSCRFLSKSQMTSSLKLKHVVITSHHFVLSFKHHSTDLITLEFCTTAPPSTLFTTFMYNDIHNKALRFLEGERKIKKPKSIDSIIKPWQKNTYSSEGDHPQVNNCSFFCSFPTMNLCSKCYHAIHLMEEDKQI